MTDSSLRLTAFSWWVVPVNSGGRRPRVLTDTVERTVRGAIRGGLYFAPLTMTNKPATNASRAARYFASIDGLRLVAAVNIVLFHLERIGGFTDLNAHPAWFFRIVKGPMFHASLFFMLAGFIFTAKYRGHADTFSTANLLRGRLRDLYPLHALTTLAMVPLALIGGTAVSIVMLSGAVHLGLLWSLFPHFTHPLNGPSWAMSAFFFCYLLFAPALRFVEGLATRRAVAGAIAASLVPATLWSVLFAATGTYDHYPFFHMFAPIRLFEFLIGMLLARLHHLNNVKVRRLRVAAIPALNDVLIVAALVAAYRLTGLRTWGAFTDFFSYHVLLPLCYSLLLYRLARGNGLVGWLFAIPQVRDLGKSSFYPYLLHVPLISWLCFVLERGLHYNRFLHSPWNVWLFVAALYAGSMVYVRWFRRRGPTYR